MRVAIIGGTAGLGKGLAARLTKAGHEVRIGSRAVERAMKVAEELSTMTGRRIEGGLNEAVVRGAEVVIVTIPFVGIYDVMRSVKEAIGEGAIVVSAVVPLASEFGGPATYVELPDGSAAETISRLLGNRISVVSAFTNLPSTPLLEDLDRPIEYDVVVCGERDPAERIIGLVESIARLRGLYGGGLRSSRVTERLTELLVNLNKHYKSDRAGLRFVGL